jgi:hypothetical protein
METGAQISMTVSSVRIRFTKDTIVGTHTDDGIWIETTVNAGDEFKAYKIIASDGTPTYDFYPHDWKQYAATVDMESYPGCFEVIA